ncbi:MAG: hypothetical protein ACQESF_01840 [Nanobdellota archaeon]
MKRLLILLFALLLVSACGEKKTDNQDYDFPEKQDNIDNKNQENNSEDSYKEKDNEQQEQVDEDIDSELIDENEEVDLGEMI